MGTTCFLIDAATTTREAIEQHMTQTLIPGQCSGFGFEYLTVRGAYGYGVMFRQDKDTQEKKHFGIVIKTSRHRTKYRGSVEFCIKEISEDMGPCESQAPAKMLDMLDQLSPNPEGYAAQWRARCRENLKRKAKAAKPAAGLKVNYGGHTYTLLTPVGPRKGWRVEQEGTGDYYRMNARQVSEALRVTA